MDIFLYHNGDWFEDAFSQGSKLKDVAAGNFLQAALTMRMIMKGEEEYQISCTVKFGNEKYSIYIYMY